MYMCFLIKKVLEYLSVLLAPSYWGARIPCQCNALWLWPSPTAYRNGLILWDKVESVCFTLCNMIQCIVPFILHYAIGLRCCCALSLIDTRKLRRTPRVPKCCWFSVAGACGVRLCKGLCDWGGVLCKCYSWLAFAFLRVLYAGKVFTIVADAELLAGVIRVAGVDSPASYCGTAFSPQASPRCLVQATVPVR